MISDPVTGVVLTVVGASLILPYYFYVLIACLMFCAVLTWRDYPNRVALFVFSLSAWFAVVWAIIIFGFAVSPKLNSFLQFALGVAVLVFSLFAACTVGSLWFYFRRRPIEPESGAAVRLGVTLLAAHVLHFVMGLGATALGQD
ncbi:MAG: hypothetical protein SGI91_04510 [Alphaproteobacteria bacterium]|jgi:hypothetical protein|nr:hypothetical protein [Alphaproteobacteria bacterium]